MALILKDRVKEGTTTTGTGAISLAGAGATFKAFTDYMSNGDTTYYAIAHTASGVNEWEVGLGTWNTGNTLTRTTVLASSNSNNAVNLSSGTKDIFMTYPSGKAVFLDASGNLTVSGDLTVSGTTTTINSTTTTVDDPVFTIGGDSAPGSDDNKDRGIEFRWHNGSAAKVGFFGFDDSTGKFTFIPDATNSSEVFSGTAGTVVAALEGNASTATALANARTIAGQSFDGTGNITIAPTDLTSVTSTAAEINILDGVTSTTAELNLLDGVTATTAELNYVDGVTSAIQTQIDTKGGINSIAVTVVDSGGNKYALDGAVQQTALLQKGVRVRFDQSDSSNSSHPLRLSTTDGGTHNSGAAFTNGVTVVGTPGSAGAYTEVMLEQDAPDLLYTYCTNHSGMGAKVYSGKDFSTLTSTVAELNILDGVTSTAAELNILDGVTSTAAELNILDGVTSTAAELNILDGVTSTAAELNILDGVTSTAAELNLVDGSSAGTIVNSKAVVYGSSGEVNATTLQVGGTAITSTPAEINLLDGVTATTAELNILDGVTSTAAELNILDGVTATAAELNIMDGVTSTTAELNILDGVTSTAAELNILDGVTSTAVELNLLDGVTATTAELNYVDGVTSAIQTQLNAKLPLAGGTMTGAIRQDQDTVAGGGGTVTLDLSASNNFKVNMTANTTFAFSNKDAGRFGNIVFVQDGTGGRSFTLPSECKTPVNGATIVQATNANEISVLSYYVLDSSNILVNYIGDFA